MSVISFFSKTSFDPQKADILAAAFDAAWARLETSGSPLPGAGTAATARELLAKNIIAVARTGECDTNRLVEGALSRLAIDPDGQFLNADDVSAP